MTEEGCIGMSKLADEQQGMIFGGTIFPSHLYMLPVEAGANVLTIPFGHAVDALCYVFSSELRSISAVLSNRYPELELIDEKTYQPKGEKKSKTSHDFISMTAELVNGGGNVDVNYALLGDYRIRGYTCLRRTEDGWTCADVPAYCQDRIGSGRTQRS
jgi:hypothetical protein